MTDHFQKIYRDQAEAYDRMVAFEDCEDRLLPAIDAVQPLEGARVAEIGVGTGRLTRLFVRGGASFVLGLDPAPAMLAVAREHMERCAPAGAACAWQLAVGTADHIPLPDAAVNLTVAGWVFGHATAWTPDRWRQELDAGLAEARRVTRPGGALILFETLGTGSESPAPPTPELAALYAHLEQERGFERRTLRTDYQFPDPEAAAEACGFFFGEPLVARIRENGWARVPEWTGLWWRRR